LAVEEDGITVKHAEDALMLDPLGGPSEPGKRGEEVVAEEAVHNPGAAGTRWHGVGNDADESFTFGEEGDFVQDFCDVDDLVEEGGGAEVEGLGHFHHGGEGAFSPKLAGSFFFGCCCCCCCCYCFVIILVLVIEHAY